MLTVFVQFTGQNILTSNKNKNVKWEIFFAECAAAHPVHTSMVIHAHVNIVKRHQETIIIFNIKVHVDYNL